MLLEGLSVENVKEIHFHVDWYWVPCPRLKSGAALSYD